MRRPIAIGAFVVLAACTATPPRVAAPAPMPAAAPPAAALAPTEDGQASLNTPGRWTYRRDPVGSSARFGLPGGAALFTIACRLDKKQVALSRVGGAAGSLTISTSFGLARWPAGVTAEGATVLLAAGDPALDRIAFSRGRFTVAVPDQPDLILPAWAEPARVIEDCRS